MTRLLAILILLIATMFVAAGVGCAASRTVQPRLERYEFKRLCMGVEARIVLYSKDQASATDAAKAGFARLAELDQILSDYRPSSELMLLCGRGGQGPVAVSEDLMAVLRYCDEIYRVTSGAFDPTLGPLTQLWREARQKGVLPAAGDIEEARARTGWGHVRLDAERRTVEIDMPGMRLDLGGIAKGYAVEQAVKMLREMDERNALVSLAGDIAVGDAPPGADGWRITLDSGLSVAGAGSGDVSIVNACVSTAGDLNQFVEVGGVRYSHILDPATGLGMTQQVAASVISREGAVADGLDTALCVLAPDDNGLRTVVQRVKAHHPGTHAVVWSLERDQHGRDVVGAHESPGFPWN